MVGPRVNHKWTLTDVCGNGRVPPRMTFKGEFPTFKKNDEPTVDVFGATFHDRIAAHNTQRWQCMVAYGQEVTDASVLARHEARRIQHLLDLVRGHTRPKEAADNLTLELYE